eukprot:g61998.t1
MNRSAVLITTLAGKTTLLELPHRLPLQSIIECIKTLEELPDGELVKCKFNDVTSEPFYVFIPERIKK